MQQAFSLLLLWLFHISSKFGCLSKDAIVGGILDQMMDHGASLSRQLFVGFLRIDMVLGFNWIRIHCTATAQVIAVFFLDCSTFICMAMIDAFGWLQQCVIAKRAQLCRFKHNKKKLIVNDPYRTYSYLFGWWWWKKRWYNVRLLSNVVVFHATALVWPP